MKPLDLPASLTRLLQPAPVDVPFLGRVVRLADTLPVVAQRDLADARGRVLLTAGSVADAARLARVAAQLADDDPADAFGLDVADATPGAVLAAEAQAALARHSLLAELVDAAGGAARVAGALAAIALPPALALHVEIARRLVPALHRHALRSALSCVALGRLGGGDAAHDTPLAAAGLLHDIGLLHADEAVIEERTPLAPAQRAQFAAHGDVAARLLRRHPPHAGAVADAVAAHHERLDGSGWPCQLHGNQVSPWARVVGLAELLTTFETDGGILDALRVSNRLRLQADAFDPRLASAVLAACDLLERR